MTAIDAISSDNSSASASAAAIDHSYAFRDTKTGPDQGVGTMGFDDFLDMINPLEHIPIVSSIYRAVTGDTINPVSRIAGDALYGGVFGLASAGISALGAVADEAFASLNDGKSASSTVVAALFGDDSDNATRLAANTGSAAATPNMQASALQTPALQSPILQLPDFAGSATPTAVAQNPSPADANLTSVPSATATAIEAGKGLALDRSKQPYGGVMDTAMVAAAQQNQSLALALMSGQDNMQAQHTLRNSRFATSTASTVTSPTAQSASLPLPGDTSLASISNATGEAMAPSQKIAAAQAQAALPQGAAQSLPAGLRQSIPQTGSASLKPIKGLDQYRSTALGVPVMGTSLDIAN